MDSEMVAKSKLKAEFIRQLRVVFPVVFGGSVLLGLVAVTARSLGLPEWIGKVTIALLSLLPMPFIIGVAVRSYHQGDELQRKMSGEALIWGFAIGTFLLYSWGLIEITTGIPRVGWFWAWMILMGSLFVGSIIARRSYR